MTDVCTYIKTLPTIWAEQKCCPQKLIIVKA